MVKDSGLIRKSVKHIYLTSEGFEQTRIELTFLKTTKREQVAERLRRALEFEDISENSEYDRALEEQILIEQRITYLEDVLQNSYLISRNKFSASDVVIIGSTVEVELSGKKEEFTIVGKVEANPSKKKISNESPLGSSLLGLKEGEEVEVVTTSTRYKCRVLKIH